MNNHLILSKNDLGFSKNDPKNDLSFERDLNFINIVLQTQITVYVPFIKKYMHGRFVLYLFWSGLILVILLELNKKKIPAQTIAKYGIAN